MAIASLNVNSLLLHIDEIRTLVKDLGIHILAIKVHMKRNFLFLILVHSMSLITNIAMKPSRNV